MTENTNLDPEQVKQQAYQVIQQSGLPPDFIIEAGRLAEAAIMDPSGSAYQQFVEFMVSRGLESREDLKKPDYQMLAMLVGMYKVLEQMEPQSPVAPESAGM